MNTEYAVGQTVYVIENDARSRGNTEPLERVVSKVGRLYFEIDGWSHRRFRIDNGIEDKDWGSKARVHTSMQEILDEREYGKLYNDIYNMFNQYSKRFQSLDQLRRISAILNEGKTEIESI